MIELYGDSIFRGAVFDRFPDEYTEEEASAEPLWALRSPAEVMNILLGESAAVFAGLTGLPEATGVEKACRGLAQDARASSADDTFVLLDVGPRPIALEEHRSLWALLARAASEGPAQVLLCGGFDRGARGDLACTHPAAFNAAIGEAAAASGSKFLELARPLAAYDKALKVGWGLSAYRKDCIHLNVWGQLRLCSLILEALGMARDGTAIIHLLAERWRESGAPSPEHAVTMAQLALA